MNVFNETKWQILAIFFFGGVGVGGGMMTFSLCNNNNNKHRLFINVTFLKLAILCLKPPLALRSPLDLVLSCTRFFLSEIIICNSNEFRNVPMAKPFIIINVI